jgi:hypothetical protein
MTAPKPHPYVVTERQSSIDWPTAVETELIKTEGMGK